MATVCERRSSDGTRVLSRYPEVLAEDAPPYGIDDVAAQAHLALAERTVSWLEQHLSTASSSD